MSNGVGFAGSAATARRLALPFLDMTVMCQAEGRAVGRVADPLVRMDRLTDRQELTVWTIGLAERVDRSQDIRPSVRPRNS
jgi:hypothetical protein